MSIARMTEIADQSQEGLTKYTGVIDSDHAYIHDAIAFTSIITTGSISAAYDVAFTTPSESSGKYIHWRPIGVDTSADYVIATLREGDTFSAGTDVVPINRNRLSDNTSRMQAFVYNATSTPAGTIIQQSGIGSSGNPSSRTGGGASAAEELVLKQNTNYVLTLVPDGATVVNLSLFWYEENAGIEKG